MATIIPKSSIKLGVVSTHIKFVDGLVPDENGNMPRDAGGKIKVVSAMEQLVQRSAAKLDCVQISLFPGVTDADYAEMVQSLEQLGLEVHLILMVGGSGNPMDPADESAVVDCIVECLQAAAKHNLSLIHI